MPQNHKRILYGLYCYDTMNIGDEIQSIAAKRFLPKIDLYINRDNIDASIYSNQADEVKLIMNGWYIESSIADGQIHWPPKAPNLNPLLTSVHISFLNGSLNTFKTVESLDFLHQHSPVGARDQATKNYLNSIGIPSYFSGCLTLTLLPDKNIKKSNFVLAADVDDETYNSIKSRTKRPILRINSVRDKNLTTNQKFKLAQYWLTLYQSAHVVITTRLHAMLPSLALGTPVIALPASDSERFTGLIDLVNYYNKKTFIQNKDISIDHPLKNPKDFIKLRDSLVDKCTAYTGYDSQKSYLDDTTKDILYSDPDLINIFTSAIQNDFFNDHKINSLNTQLQKKENILNSVLQELEEVKNPGVKKSTKYLLKAIKKRFN